MKSLSPDLARYFIAIIPPPPIFEEVLMLKNHFREKYNSKASLNSPPHITIHAPFLWREKEEITLSRSLELFAKGKKSMKINLFGFGAFKKRVIFISVEGNEELKELQGQLKKFCVRELNLSDDNQRSEKFHPHLTLAFRDLKAQQFDLAWKEFMSKKFSASFSVDGFDLLKHDSQKWQSLHHFHF